jgi:hypothetical protein
VSNRTTTSVNLAAIVALAVSVAYFSDHDLPWVTNGPRFKVIEESVNLNPRQSVLSKILKIQLLEEQPITVSKVVVNNSDKCASGQFPASMKYGEERALLLWCEPVSVSIITERGESAYEMH